MKRGVTITPVTFRTEMMSHFRIDDSFIKPENLFFLIFAIDLFFFALRSERSDFHNFQDAISQKQLFVNKLKKNIFQL